MRHMRHTALERHTRDNWEPEEHLQTCSPHVQEFNQRLLKERHRVLQRSTHRLMSPAPSPAQSPAHSLRDLNRSGIKILVPKSPMIRVQDQDQPRPLPDSVSASVPAPGPALEVRHAGSHRVIHRGQAGSHRGQAEVTHRGQAGVTPGVIHRGQAGVTLGSYTGVRLGSHRGQAEVTQGSG
ncbi:hypothetical protein WMY93_031634 [Mugilogobius chulae]|uniref:Uncharacterized protein n=1 Tax=Mugilogobius chulae TaxID=88201 RepID=A0AAW0MKK2_9GOBI